MKNVKMIKMEEPKLKNKKEIIKKLKPFWKEMEKIKLEHYKKIRKIEEDMNKELGIKTKLEFFYCDGEICGIGAEHFNDRKKFPLLTDSELEGLE